MLMLTPEINQLHDVQWCSRDISNYFYEGKKNFFCLMRNLLIKIDISTMEIIFESLYLD